MNKLIYLCLLVWLFTFSTEGTALSTDTTESYAFNDIQRVRIDFTMPNGYVRHLLLAFTPNNAATDGVDYGYDALNVDSFPDDLNWMIENQRYVIQGVGAFNDTKQYPLGMFISNPGDIAIALDALENFNSEINVYLYDALHNTYTLLNEVDFQETVNTGNHLNRYYIAFKNNTNGTIINQAVTVLSIEDLATEEPSISFLRQSKEIYINSNQNIVSFHPLTILDCQRERIAPEKGDHLPKVEDYHRYLFSIINPVDLKTLEPNPDIYDEEDDVREIVTRQINAYLGKNFLITHHYELSEAVRRTADACSKNPTFFERGPDFVYHLILDDIVGQANGILDYFDERTESLEQAVFGVPDEQTLHQILVLKRQGFKLRKIMSYQREMINRLARGEFELITQEELAYYRNVFDHILRVTDTIESYRDIIASLLDAYLSIASNRMNEVMKVLTLFSTIFLPLTFIAGIYGMNFKFMPELEWPLGYLYAVVLMGIISGAMLFYFKKKKWL